LPFQEGNPELWVQLGEEPQDTSTDIRETVQELKDEVAHLCADNERLMLEQEKIIKILSDRQNNWPLVPSLECTNMSGETKF